jgi:primase-polymerase (primpol)-like protein
MNISLETGKLRDTHSEGKVNLSLKREMARRSLKGSREDWGQLGNYKSCNIAVVNNQAIIDESAVIQPETPGSAQ